MTEFSPAESGPETALSAADTFSSAQPSVPMPTGEWKLPRTRRQECLRYGIGRYALPLFSGLSALLRSSTGGHENGLTISFSRPPASSAERTFSRFPSLDGSTGVLFGFFHYAAVRGRLV